MHAAQRYSLGDWAASVLLFCVGLYLDKARPFEQYIGNRLADPSISYPHTPPEKQQVTANQLWCIALVFPACGLLRVVFNIACALSNVHQSVLQCALPTAICSGGVQ